MNSLHFLLGDWYNPSLKDVKRNLVKIRDLDTSVSKFLDKVSSYDFISEINLKETKKYTISTVFFFFFCLWHLMVVSRCNHCLHKSVLPNRFQSILHKTIVLFYAIMQATCCKAATILLETVSM